MELLKLTLFAITVIVARLLEFFTLLLLTFTMVNIMQPIFGSLFTIVATFVMVYVFIGIGEYWFRNFMKHFYNLMIRINFIPNLSSVDGMEDRIEGGMTLNGLLKWMKLK